MEVKHERLQLLSRRASGFLLAGTLALALTPAAAFATDGLAAGQASKSDLTTQHYEYVNNTGKAIIGDAGDPLNDGVELVSSEGNVYTYRGYAHSDNGGHYQGYSLYTEITTDDDGIVTAIDVTSGNDTFAGMWGYQTAGMKGVGSINGILPDGVDFSANKNSDGTYTPVITGWEKYNTNEPQPTVTFISTNADGTKDATGEAERVENTGKLSDGKITIPEEGNINLVRCRYIFGSEKMTFDTYFSVGDNAGLADQYIDNVIGETTWTDEPTSGYTTNRDRWTHIMGTVMLRELGSWGAFLQSGETESDLDGELDSLDTVSGATKTAVPFVEALKQAEKDGNIKGVSSDVALTIDKNSKLPEIDVNANSKDLSTVSANEDGQYVLSVVFPYKDTLKRNDVHGVTLDKITVYGAGDTTVGTMGMMYMAKASDTENPYADKKIAEYTPQVKSGRSSAWVADTSAATNGQYQTAVDDENITFEYEASDWPLVIVAKNKAITHVVMQYTLGHGTIAIAYDLANMSKVATTSADELPFDVRPFKAQSEAAMELAGNAATAIQERNFARAHTVSAVELEESSYTYTGEACEPGVKVTAIDGSALDAAAYDVAYENNVDAGTATVTVTGKGDYSGTASAEFAIAPASIDSVKFAAAKVTYNGKKQEPAVTVMDAKGATLPASAYDVAYANNINAGTATATVTGKGNYVGTKTATFTIAKAANKVTLKKATKKVKLKKVKKKAQTVAIAKASVTSGAPAATYSIAKVNKSKKKFSIDKATGKITVKKGTKKGTYKVTVKATSGNANYNTASTSAVITIKVK